MAGRFVVSIAGRVIWLCEWLIGEEHGAEASAPLPSDAGSQARLPADMAAQLVVGCDELLRDNYDRYFPTTTSEALCLVETLLTVAAGQVRGAASDIHAGSGQHVPILLSAAWRVADAGAFLRMFLEADKAQGLGLTQPTGRGAVLPGDFEHLGTIAMSDRR